MAHDIDPVFLGRIDVMSSDERHNAREYAWNYFALHAEQRLKMFNFFLILTGILLSAFPAVSALSQSKSAVTLIPVLLLVVSFIFWRLEERTRALVKNAEHALRTLDECWLKDPLPAGSGNCLQLFKRDDYLTKRIRERWWMKLFVPISYSDSFRLAYLMIGLTGVFLLANTFGLL